MQINNISLHLSITIILKTCSASSSTKYVYSYTCTFPVNVAHTGVQLQAVWGVTLSQELVTCKLAYTYTGSLHALCGHTKKSLVHNILIHHPAEGKGDCRGMKMHWKESRTLCETISKETNKDGTVASRFKFCVCHNWGLPHPQSDHCVSP